MSILSLIDSTVLGVTTLALLIVIAALLAWLVGYLYARQLRFHSDLLTTLHKVGQAPEDRLEETKHQSTSTAKEQ